MCTKHASLFILLIFLFQRSSAQVSPLEGATLNALHVFMQAEPGIKAKEFVFKVAPGYYDNEHLFNKNLIREISTLENSLLNKLTDFNKEYTWQVVYKGETGKVTGVVPLHHFRIISDVEDSTKKYRVRVLENKYKDRNLYFFLDGTHSIYDLGGNAVWHLSGIEDAKAQTRS